MAKNISRVKRPPRRGQSGQKARENKFGGDEDDDCNDNTETENQTEQRALQAVTIFQRRNPPRCRHPPDRYRQESLVYDFFL